MTGTGLVMGGLGVVVVALGVFGAAGAAEPGASGDRLRQDLEAVARLRVYFGHQSVGANVLAGLEALSSEAGVPLRIAEVPDARALSAPAVGHGQVGANGDPRGKLAAFERALPAGAAVDVALVKFCYLDLDAGTDATRLFGEYEATLRRLSARHPGTVFVHVTAPLHADQGFLKTTLKRLLGRGAGALADNAGRERYNALLRAAYEGREPVFDLARLEATAADGRLETATWEGKPVPVLAAAYTDDGGHLNAEGRRRAARALAALLAGLPARPAQAGGTRP